jgi:1-deoxy-D-xylulose-5-phosphate reductoisomerase
MRQAGGGRGRNCLPDLRDALAGSGIEAAGGARRSRGGVAMGADWTMARDRRLRRPQAGHGGDRGRAARWCSPTRSRWFPPATSSSPRRAHGATLLPADSEHNAIFQCFDFARPERVRRIILTASGGPFRDWPLEEMRGVTPEQAVAHPNWSMGAKISVDSATMMNKGLELIEARACSRSADQIEIVVHRQSVIHSMVEYVDGSMLAQLGPPDMRTPIAHCLAWPDRMETPMAPLDLVAIGRLDFEAPDPIRFPALALARRRWRRAVRARRSSMRPMRSPWPPSSTERSASSKLPQSSPIRSIATIPPAPTLDDVLMVDAKRAKLAGERVAQGLRDGSPPAFC